MECQDCGTEMRVKRTYPSGTDKVPTSTTVCAGGYGRTAPGVHDFRGGPIKGRRWCVKLGCGAWEPRSVKGHKAKGAGAPTADLQAPAAPVPDEPSEATKEYSEIARARCAAQVSHADWREPEQQELFGGRRG